MYSTCGKVTHANCCSLDQKPEHIGTIYWSFLYSAILRSWVDSLHSHVILHEWIAFYSVFLNIHRSGVLTELAWLVPQESAARERQSRCILCTPYNHAPCHFMQSHIRKVYVCLAVTCHLRFWQNDRGLLRATVVTRGWNGYRNKSQHRKLTLEKRIFPPLQQGFEPATFRSRVRRSNHWAIPAPQICGATNQLQSTNYCQKYFTATYKTKYKYTAATFQWVKSWIKTNKQKTVFSGVRS